MTAASMVFCLALATQEPAPGPGTVTKAATASERARAEREATIAKRKDKARALRRAEAAKQEAELRDYELKMAPIIANQQIEMAHIRAQQQQNERMHQALINQQAIEAARLSNQNLALQLQYWASRQPMRVIIETRQPDSPAGQ